MTTLSVVVSHFLNPLVGYRCGLLREKFSDLNAFRVNMHSLVATICINITELSPITVPNQKPLLNCKEATDLFLDKDWSPCQWKARLRELLKGKLTSDELVELTLAQKRVSTNSAQNAKVIQISQFIYEKCKKKSGETRKAAVKNEFIELCVHIFRAW